MATIPQFKLLDAPIKTITTEESMKYLGEKFCTNGVARTNTSDLNTCLSRLARAPLKPHQKLEFLKLFCLPRFLTKFQGAMVCMKMLKEADRKVRYFVKRTLHLFSHVSNSVIHAPVREGGLGVLSFSQRIPIIMENRLEALEGVDHILDAAINLAGDWVRRIARMVDPTASTKAEVAAKNSAALNISFFGNGINQAGNNGGCSRYLTNPPPYWSSEDYISAIHLRFNLLPCKSMPTVPRDERRCRAGCFRGETLSHILQSCPATHWPRIQRHNFVAKRVAVGARKAGWTVLEEPHIRDDDRRLHKPDLLMRKDEQVIICDVAVHWEGPNPLTVAYEHKEATYSTSAFLRKVESLYPEMAIYVLPLVVGARGTWCHKNKGIIERVGLGARVVDDIIHTAMRGGWMAHRHFMRTIWR